MDWLIGMNKVINYVENNMTEKIDYDHLAKMLCCSNYEFSRIFSFVAGVSISEYIRRRRLSLAAFDVQDREQKIIDIGIKYGYESPASFTRAFKELHGASPNMARKEGLPLKTYPKISFKLTIKGVEEMNFRMVKKDAFQIIGLKGMSTFVVHEGEDLDPLWTRFMESHDARLAKGTHGDCYYRDPFWQVAAYSNKTTDGETPCIIGAQLGDKPVLEGMDVQRIPAMEWAVFTITCVAGTGHDEAYARIQTEWFPTSRYVRNTDIPHLEVYPGGDGTSEEYQWEIWMPVLAK